MTKSSPGVGVWLQELKRPRLELQTWTLAVTLTSTLTWRKKTSTVKEASWALTETWPAPSSSRSAPEPAKAAGSSSRVTATPPRAKTTPEDRAWTSSTPADPTDTATDWHRTAPLEADTTNRPWTFARPPPAVASSSTCSPGRW